MGLPSHARSRLLEKLDDKLCAEKSNEWIVAKKERVKKVSLTGEPAYEKRIYRQKDIGISRCLLDELVKAPRRSRTTPAFAEMAARIACDLSFQKTAYILETFSKSSVSKSTIKEFVTRAEDPLEKNDREQVRNFLVLGEKPQGKISAFVLYIESDATYLASQEPDWKRRYTAKELRAIQEKIDNYYTRSWDKSLNYRAGETEFRCQGTISNTKVKRAVQDFLPDF